MEQSKGWLETREISWRVKQPVAGIINTAIVLIIFFILWRVFMDPTGPIKWYTPLFGVVFITGITAVTIWHAVTFDFWPFTRERLAAWSPLTRGVILTGFYVGAVIAIYLFFTYVFGMLGVTYFSSLNLTRAGISAVIAREQASFAIVSFLVIVLIMALVLKNAFEQRPWHLQKQPLQGFSVFIWSTLLGVAVFSVFVHPHFGIVYLPWQEYAVAFPWWQPFVRTLHGNFSMGLLMSYLVVIFLSGTIWENKPWDIVKSQPWRGLFTLGGTILIALIFYTSFLFINELRWGPPIEGAFRLQSISWRFLHAGEMTFFLVIPALVLYFYFDNWPRKYEASVNWVFRTVIVIVGGVILYWAYYAFAPEILNVVRGYADPDQFPIASLMLIVMLILLHSWSFDGWPVGRRKALQ